MIDVEVRHESDSRVGFDSPELTLGQVITIVGIVKQGVDPP